MDFRIGILNSAAGPIYYAFVGGHDQPETRGSLAEVETALGLRLPKNRRPRVRPPREYEVTVKPSIILHGVHGASGDYTVTLIARTAAEAIKTARDRRRDEEGRFAPKGHYSAKRTTQC